MKQWLSESVTRAEAIAWSLLTPALGVIAVSGMGIVQAAQTVRRMSGTLPARYSPLMSASVSMGETWLGVTFVAFGAVAILALITRQRTWVRLAAPITLGLLAWSLQHLYAADLKEWIAAGALLLQEQSKVPR